MLAALIGWRPSSGITVALHTKKQGCTLKKTHIRLPKKKTFSEDGPDLDNECQPTDTQNEATLRVNTSGYTCIV